MKDSGKYKENSKTVNNLKDIIVRVDKIRVKGLCRTKDDIVVNSLQNLFKVNTFQGLIENLVETRSNLERLSCFKNIGITIDTSTGLGATPNYGYDVIFDVTEYSRLSGSHMTSTIENNQVSVGLELLSPNLAGRGESVQVEWKSGYKEMRAFNCSFLKPLFFCNSLFSTSIFKRNSENNAAGYKLSEYGISSDLSFSYSSFIKHNLTWEAVIRNIAALDKYAPFAVHEQSGYTLKSAFRNVLNIDTRDSKVLPTTGNLLQLQSELAGFGGNIGFVKNEIMSQFNVPIINDITLQSSFAVGIMNSASKDKHTTVVDNFFLGGPLTLRGFQLNGIGPKVENYFAGGSLYFLNSFHVYTPLPHKPKKGSFGDAFRIHFFFNMGNITHVNSDVNQCIGRLNKDFRSSYGIGLLFRFHQLARFELNYCIPLFYQDGDRIIKGVQFGFGIQFV